MEEHVEDDAVPAVRRHLRVSRPAHRKPWTSEEDETLKRRLAAGHTVSEIASELGRTREAVRNRGAVFGLSVSSGSKRAKDG